MNPLRKFSVYCTQTTKRRQIMYFVITRSGLKFQAGYLQKNTAPTSGGGVSRPLICPVPVLRCGSALAGLTEASTCKQSANTSHDSGPRGGRMLSTGAPPPRFTSYPAPCGIRGCKNRPAPFPGRMSYKATISGSVCPLS